MLHIPILRFLNGDSLQAKEHANRLLTEALHRVGAMKALPTTCIVGLIAFMGFYLAGGNRPVATVPDATPEAAANAVAPALYAEASAKLAAALQAATASVTSAGSGPLTVRAEIADDSVGPKLASLGDQATAQPPPVARDASNDALKPAQATQDFRHLIYYVWSELPPAQKPAEIVLRSFKDIPVGTPIEEIKRASVAFGLDFNFMKAVAKIESGFNPNRRTGSYIGLFQLSEKEFGKFGFGQIRSPRDNAVAAAYKVITEGILFEWITHRKLDLSDLYLIHQQGWEGAAEHISQPDRIAWKSMCATSEGREKGAKWCRRAIWGNTLPALKKDWKSVDKVTSKAFVGMWRARVAEFYTKYMATADGGATP
ncbi:lytic transglycosylase domain-containing protein [Bradyrhizobium sp. AUGA SZCCT0177]|uniref:lytic transglycosylase domain-containing protein n=1 Tax=Bradyrhizobium sp. AUGA SZCCT0177 TaxID=2807665 RepID=UPI0020128766|nr:lytic transglycosylase domain-containing protein [Bradyrhizobium sp. AUGA SZCCT0177]